MANPSEPLLTVVIDTTPKVLTGVTVVGPGASSSPGADTVTTGGEAGPTPSMVRDAERGKPVALPAGTARREARPRGGRQRRREQANAAL